jgi:ribosome-binding protein aMBF1 (putative translation factor)
MAKKTNAVEILKKRFGKSPGFAERVNEEKLNAQVAILIHDARSQAGLTQKQLAELIGTKQQVIARLEDADYEGHSLSMLQRIATALDKKLVVDFISPESTFPITS